MARKGEDKMTKQQVNIILAAILSTLKETKSSPESMLYIGTCGMDMTKWELIRDILLLGKLVTIENNLVTITARGMEIAEKIDAMMKA